MKKIYNILLCLLAALAATACIYDYNPQIEGEGGYLIVEGNIVVGDYSDISTNWSWSLVDSTDAQSEERARILASNRMHIEASNGTRYEPVATAGFLASGRSARFDMREADPSLEYRLVIENIHGTYASLWESALPPGEIDSLSFAISEDKHTMSIRVSSHSGEGPGSYYRWSVTETWEYHADTYALYKVVEEPEFDVVPLEYYEENNYRCWQTMARPEIMTATTEGLTEDRLVNHQLYTLDYHDERVSVLYSPEVVQMRIPEEAYRYWQVMQRNSEDVGGLFSPEPSELRGNVANVDDPSEMVLGYVGVMSVSRRRMMVDNLMTQFYKKPYSSPITLDTLRTKPEYLECYQKDWLPSIDIFSDNGGWLGIEWWPARCVDCRRKGGTRDKPKYWP